ncbi:MAG TPA: alpha/beta hydrolase [Chryseosolibacter sp.]|nr:alpha/beta hydrolase [Chryseosolibacter sp.]
MHFTSQILLHPGLNNSGTNHWQTWWEKRFPAFKRIQQFEWDQPVLHEWMETLDREVSAYDSPNVIIVAHSLACCTVVNWAYHYKRKIKGALLVAPSDTESANYPPGTTGFTPMPLHKLAFPSTVVISSDDKFVSIERAQTFASAWGSELVNIGRAGHINSDSKLGFWEFGLELLSRLDRS